MVRSDKEKTSVEQRPRTCKEMKAYEPQIEGAPMGALEKVKNSRSVSTDIFSLGYVAYNYLVDAVVLVSTLSFFLQATTCNLAANKPLNRLTVFAFVNGGVTTVSKSIFSTAMVHLHWLNVWGKSLTATTQERCEQYWTSPGGNTPQSSCTDIYHASRKLSKLCEPCMTGHCWRSKNKLKIDVLLWTPLHGRAKAGRPARTNIQ